MQKNFYLWLVRQKSIIHHEGIPREKEQKTRGTGGHCGDRPAALDDNA